ncbi:MAG: sigma-70 family RNA polymerase sigma factor [Chloroflexi bacterium]|nr:sigma-70 family RNA polymerase sigma factor [Chloroflexota bacterium]MCL5274308.1 sigma-70 family RNA polymerase sigma factor [Chloroflexota bacterium]
MDEPALIQSAQRGDINAFNTLVLAYQSQVYNVAFRIMGDEAPAADAAQETFISAYRSIRSFRGGSFKSWLLRTVTNACYDALRYNKRRPATSLDAFGEDSDSSSGGPAGAGYEELIASAEESPSEAAERSELRHAITRAIKLLPADQRITFVLSDVQGMSYDEIADAMQTSLGTVKSRLSRARARLRDYLLNETELIGAPERQ